MSGNKFDLSTARYLDILFPWDEELCSYEPVDIEDEENETIPMVSNGYWHGIIDLKEHTLTDCPVWPYNLNAKVRDAGIYTLLDADKQPLRCYRGYVPSLPFDEHSWGDYIHMSVGQGNSIINWTGDLDLSVFKEQGNPITPKEYDILLDYHLKKLKTFPSRNESETMEYAARLMLDMHEGQRDKGGEPYFLHPMRVALNCESAVQKTVAFLHDVMEDAGLSSQELKRHGFSDEIVEAVLALTRKSKEDYETFIQRCALNPLARYVKIRDIEDNLNVERLQELDYAATARINKYLKVLRFLKSEDFFSVRR